MIFPKRNKIDKNKKINFNFEKKYEQSKPSVKPSGFWYSCYSSWYNWVNIEMPHLLYKYIHKININKNVLTNIRYKNKEKILVINNIKDFDLFNKKYGYIDKNNLYELIQWAKVEKDYGGIEICPYLTERSNYLWYSSFDVASGCIWNIKSIIKNSELVYEKIKNKYVKVL